jgi:hypothetical protein
MLNFLSVSLRLKRFKRLKSIYQASRSIFSPATLRLKPARPPLSRLRRIPPPTGEADKQT